MDIEPRPTKLVLAIGSRAADSLQQPLRDRLRAFGDAHGAIEVVVSPFEEDAHCPEGTEGMRPDEDFSAWCDALARRSPTDASFVWVFRHFDRSDVVNNLVALANDPDAGYLVLGEDPRCMAYLGSNVTYIPIGPMNSAEERLAVAYAIAEAVLSRFPTPAEEPLIPWSVLARVNYRSTPRAIQSATASRRVPPPPPPIPPAGFASSKGTHWWDGQGWRRMDSAPPGVLWQDGKWWWDGQKWSSMSTAPPEVRARVPAGASGQPGRALLPAQAPQAENSPAGETPGAAAGQAPKSSRWRWGRAKRAAVAPPGAKEVATLFESHTPMTIVVMGAKGGLGATRTSIGLLLAAQEAAEAAGLRGVPLLGIDSDPRQATMADLLRIQYPSQNQPFRPLWDVMAEHTASGTFREPAASGSQVFVYRQGEDVRDLQSMFGADGHRRPGRYDLRRFMSRVHEQYRVAVVDASSHRDVAFLWTEVADGVVVLTEDSPQTVTMTRQLLVAYQLSRQQGLGRSHVPVVCAWWEPYRPTHDVREQKRKIVEGFDIRAPSGALHHVEGTPILEIPADRGLHNAVDHAGIHQSSAMSAYRSIFGLLVRSMGTRRLRG